MMGSNDFYYCNNNFDEIKNNIKENNNKKIELEKNSNSNSFASTSESDNKNMLLENSCISEIIKKGLNSLSNRILANKEDNFGLAYFYHCDHRNEDYYKYTCKNRIKNLYDRYLQKENKNDNKII